METVDPRGTNEGILKVSKRMFIGGFFLLPWLWLVNYIYLRKYIARPSCPPQARFYVRASLAGFVIVTLCVLTWTIIYLSLRNNMGVWGDRLAVVVPKGA
jgi:presenilin enhancer 2